LRVLLDECVPKQLKRYIQEHEVATVPEAGWAGYKNGRLLREASREYDLMVTTDRSMSFQRGHLPAGFLVGCAQSP
jgi:hypothetical protein